jgi:hypothetical protein
MPTLAWACFSENFAAWPRKRGHGTRYTKVRCALATPRQSDAGKIHVFQSADKDLPKHCHLSNHKDFSTEKVLVSNKSRLAGKIT